MKLLRHILKALLWVFLVSVFVFSVMFVSLYYFGEHFMKQFLYEKIHQTSDGLYAIEFDDFKLNLVTGNVTMTDFKLIPNDSLYRELRKQGKVKSTLYAFSYEKLTLHRLHLKEIYLDRIIHLREIELDKPHTRLVAFPDSTTHKKGRFNLVYQDIYPVFSKLFHEVKIDSIVVREGVFHGKQTLKSGEMMAGDWKYSATLREFLIRAGEYQNEERIFYSKDVELRILDFRYALSDSLYLLQADEVGFSLMGSRLFGKGLVLTPNFKGEAFASSKAGSFYQVFLPKFSIDGIDLFKAILHREIIIQAVEVADLSVKLFRHKTGSSIPHPKPKTRTAHPNISVANLYTIIQGKLTEVNIDTVLMRDASFHYFPSVKSNRPELRVDRADLLIEGFMLDSLAHLDTTKILYSEEIDFDLEGFTLTLEDKLHDLSAQKVKISTHADQIEILNTLLVPTKYPDTNQTYKSNSYYHMLFPEVLLEKINIRKMFNTRNLEFSRLALMEPDMSIIQFRGNSTASVVDTVPPGNKAGNADQETFIEKLNLIQKVIIPYIISLRAGEIEVASARFAFKDEKGGVLGDRISGLADLTITGLEIDTTTYAHHKTFLNELEVDLSLLDFNYTSLDSLHHVALEAFHVNSVSRNLIARDFKMFTTSKIQPDIPSPSTVELQLDTLLVNGFDHRLWISNQWFYGGDIRLINPEVRIRSFRKRKKNTLGESFAGVEEKLGKIVVDSLVIQKGLFDFVEDHGDSRGLFYAEGFDFQLEGFLFDLTKWKEGHKVLRYDYLSLNPVSNHPVIIDSNYAISFSKFVSKSYPPEFLIEELVVHTIEQDSLKKKPLVVDFSLPLFEISRLDLENALFERNLDIGTISIKQPEIHLIHRNDSNTRIKRKPGRKLTSQPKFTAPFYEMNIDSLDLTDGLFHFTVQTDTSITTKNLTDLQTRITGFYYDTIVENNDPNHLFYCKDIEISTGPYTMVTKDSMNTLSVAGLWFSTQQAKMVVDSFTMIPNYSDSLYSRILGYQTDRMDLRTSQIAIDRLDFKTLLEQKRLNIGLIEVEGLVMEDYRDKRVPYPTWKRPPMIQEALRKIAFPMTIDSLMVHGGKVTYREQTGAEPGMIFFDGMEVLARNFTTDSTLVAQGVTLIADGAVDLMGKARVRGEFQFPLNSETDTFYFAGKAGRVPMTLFNPMVSNVAPVRIKSGVVDSLSIKWIRGNHDYANGILDLYYHGLQIDLLNKKDGVLSKLGNEVLNMLINMAVPQENPGYFGIHRRGYIWEKRNIEKGYFNFFWHSILTGLMSSEGINTKEQRKFKRQMKREEKTNRKDKK
jgi:hypothetical protein